MKALTRTLTTMSLLRPCMTLAMTPGQQGAFRGANTGNSGFTELDSSFLIQGTAAVLVFLWFCWVLMSAYKAWGARRLSMVEAGGQALRAMFVFIITLVVVTY